MIPLRIYLRYKTCCVCQVDEFREPFVQPQKQNMPPRSSVLRTARLSRKVQAFDTGERVYKLYVSILGLLLPMKFRYSWKLRSNDSNFESWMTLNNTNPWSIMIPCTTTLWLTTSGHRCQWHLSENAANVDKLLDKKEIATDTPWNRDELDNLWKPKKKV